jgi:hypothetical protein
MKHPYECKKAIRIAAQIDGTGSHKYIKCDLTEYEGHPVVMLFWPKDGDDRGRYCRIDPADISEHADEHGIYTHTGDPIPLPKSLAEMRPARVSEDGFRLGFFFLPENQAV